MQPTIMTLLLLFCGEMMCFVEICSVFTVIDLKVKFIKLKNVLKMYSFPSPASRFKGLTAPTVDL